MQRLAELVEEQVTNPTLEKCGLIILPLTEITMASITETNSQLQILIIFVDYVAHQRRGKPIMSLFVIDDFLCIVNDTRQNVMEPPMKGLLIHPKTVERFGVEILLHHQMLSLQHRHGSLETTKLVLYHSFVTIIIHRHLVQASDQNLNVQRFSDVPEPYLPTLYKPVPWSVETITAIPWMTAFVPNQNRILLNHVLIVGI